MSSPALDKVKALIAENKVMVFSKTYCPYCTKAKNVFNKYNLPSTVYKVVELDNMADGQEYQDALKQITGESFVPRCFVGGNFIGGGDDVAKKESAGELKTLLAQAGATA